MENSTIVEPVAVFAERRADVEDDSLAFVAADPHLINLLRSGPMDMMKLLNVVGRSLPAKSKRQRVAIKREVLRRLGTLIRRRQLRRIKRKSVALPAVGL